MDSLERKSMSSYRKDAPGWKKSLAVSMRHKPTQSEAKMWEQLKRKKLGVRFRRQVILGRWIVDFFCHSENLIIELDGRFHSFRHRRQKEKEKNEGLEKLGYRILRIPSRAVFDELPTIISRINELLKSVNTPGHFYYGPSYAKGKRFQTYVPSVDLTKVPPQILSEKEYKILEMRFGVGDHVEQSHTLEKIGKTFGVTRERIRQIQVRALKKIKNAGISI